MSDDSQSASAIQREVVEEVVELLDKHRDSHLWNQASDEMCADYALAELLLRGELKGEHAPAAKASSEVL